MQHHHQHCVRSVASLVAVLLLELQGNVHGRRAMAKPALVLDSELEVKSNESAASNWTWPVSLPWLPCSSVRYKVEEESLKNLATWCNAAMVPEDKRVPHKLQGLFWLKGLPLPDVAACFSRGTWDSESRTITLSVWDNFLYKNQKGGKALAWYLHQNGLTYKIKFNSSELDYADISPSTGKWLHKAEIFLFDMVTSFPLIKLDSEGHKWHRPSYFGIGGAKKLTNEYAAWRILDGSGNVIKETMQTMVEQMPAQGVNEIVRYPAECWDEPRQCSHTAYPVQTPGLQELAAWCNAKNLPETETPVPKKVQGLYWLKGLPLQDVFACFTRGSWDEEHRSLTVKVFHNFLFRNTPEGMGLAKTVWDMGVTYHVNFDSPELKSADITATSYTARGWIPIKVFNFFTKFPLEEQAGSDGTKWSRPSYLKVGPWEKLINEYEAWKVLDGDGVLVENTYQEMMKEFAWQSIHEVIGFNPETCT